MERRRQDANGCTDADIGANVNGKGGNGIISFVRFITSDVRNLARAITGVGGDDDDEVTDEEDELLNPSDPRPLSDEDHDVIMLVMAFSTKPSTIDKIFLCF